MRTFLVLTLATEFVLMGYVIGKYDLDDKLKAFMAREVTRAIAEVKAIPPAGASLAVKNGH